MEYQKDGKIKEIPNHCTRVLTNGTKCNTMLVKITPIYEKIAEIKCPECGKIYDFVKKYELMESEEK